MCISGIASRMLHIRYTFKTYITVTYQNTAILKSFNRAVTCRIAEFMAVHCAVNEIVCTIKFTVSYTHLDVYKRQTQMRLELTTSAVTGRRSNQLSHWALQISLL